MHINAHPSSFHPKSIDLDYQDSYHRNQHRWARIHPSHHATRSTLALTF
jgi:hypothetical protein